MNNFGTLYRFELRKLLKKRIVWICAIIMLALAVVMPAAPLLGDHYVETAKAGSNYEAYQVDRAYQLQLDGRRIDQTLLEEMQAAYAKVPMGVERYSLTQEYQTYARPYSEIFNFVRQVTGMTVAQARQWAADEDELYAWRMEETERDWQECRLTDAEMKFWRAQDERVEKPIVFRAKESYWSLLSVAYTMGIMVVLITAICLSGVFTDEHARRTDQLILSSRYGRAPVYWAKVLAGISLSCFLSLLTSAVAWLVMLLLCGAEGFDAAFQLIRPHYSYPLSAGEAALIAYGVVIACGIVTGAFTMMLSEALRSGIGTLAIVAGGVLLGMFVYIPEHYRVLAQLWGCLPGQFAAIWNVFSVWTVPVFGKIFPVWQAVPVIYMAFAVIFAWIGKKIYTGYQVSGR